MFGFEFSFDSFLEKLENHCAENFYIFSCVFLVFREEKNLENYLKKENSFSKMEKCVLIVFVVSAMSGLCTGRGLYAEESPAQIRIEQCHEGCIKKVSISDGSGLSA